MQTIYHQPTIVDIPAFTVIGVTYDANLQQIVETNIGTSAYKSLISRKDEIGPRLSENVHLVQIYPMKENFNPHVDAFTQILAFEVPEGSAPPKGMIVHNLPARSYVTMTHIGPESELGRTYDLLYNDWMRQNGRQPDGYDFEVWDERYKHDQEDNEIDVFIALKEL
ncbi:GyrI-like domain-containing protein [Paenibacillus sp. N4]|uniref:GyrI-like domain-containing protein n=1 Tax=Paenibacillus vietnamensis TaxID=2590547 RepID=UPI001CD09D7D|nr:GyrI-like domain-containing protein [Paenibacillus vietnamensis]MCA0757172.1 GyrI-like domain-containing protein [Paenibacillus vietnamensis]